MPWFRLDDSFHSHPKVIAAGNEAIGLFIRCGTYAAQNLTDGAVPRDIAELYGARTPRTLGDGQTETLGDTLVRVGLWHRARAGWRIHDYLDYNFSREQVLKDRKAAAERQRKWKQARQHGKGNAVSNAVTNTTPPRPAPKGSGAGKPAPGVADARASPPGSLARNGTTPTPPPVADVLAGFRQQHDEPEPRGRHARKDTST